MTDRLEKAQFLRWTFWFVLALVFAVTCWGLSQWQLARLAEAKAEIAIVNENFDAPPLTSLPGSFDSKLEYRIVELRGNYAPNTSLLVRNRPQNGQPGFEQFFAFLTDTNQVVFIDRGWLPTGNKQDAPDVVPMPNLEQVTIQGRIIQNSENLVDTAPAGQLSHASAILASNKLGFAKDGVVTDYYLALASETPANVATPKLFSRPQLDEGNHLSYAFQWVIFALMAIAAVVWAIRKERNLQLEKPKKRASKRNGGQSDESYEDSLTESN